MDYLDKKLTKEAKAIKNSLGRIWASKSRKTKEKFSNINGKTGRYDVPPELFQNRTHRSSRVLIRWKLIKSNNITLDQLKTFYGGVCVELVNEDYFNVKNSKDELSKYIIKKIGSNEKISAIVSFRNEDGDSGALVARRSYAEFLNKEDKDNFPYIFRNTSGYTGAIGKGDNSVWGGKLFVSIRGGSQESIESHKHKNERVAVFNPAVDYANEMICLDIDLTMSYFALHCADLNKKEIEGFDELKKRIEVYLSSRVYDTGNLLDYCLNHPSLKIGKGILIDPIQLDEISIENFCTSGKEKSSVICHNESVDKGIFYFDKRQKCLLSAARPTNLFWSTHLSNMMQQNYSLEGYFEMELKRYNLRQKLLNK